MLVFIVQIIFIGSIIGMLVIVLRKIPVLRNLPVFSKQNSEEIIEVKKKFFLLPDFSRLKRKIKYLCYWSGVFLKKKISLGFWWNLLKRRKEKKSEGPDLSPDYWQKIKSDY